MTNATELSKRFPNLKPVKGSPPLFRLNGCGLAVYGRRDYDAETKTYVKTYCLSFVFFPIVPICAYRVADTGNGGWYFLGREPLSLLAKCVNYTWLMALLVGVGAGAWRSYVESPAYRARLTLEQAEACENKGQWFEAADKYAKVRRTPTPSAEIAGSKLVHLAETALTAGQNAETSKIVLAAANLPGLGADREKLCQLALARIKALVDAQPKDALRLLPALPLFGFSAKEYGPLKEQVLRKVLEQDPTQLEAAVELALAAEQRKDFAACEKLLAPFYGKLGDTEGARILGGIYGARGKLEEAFKLLAPYVETRLKVLHQAEDAYAAAVKACNEQWLSFLRAGRASKEFYQEFKGLGEKERRAKVDEFIMERMGQDPAIQNCQSDLKRCAQVVPVALQLGATRLQRAQAMTEAAERKRELEAAEKLFMSIQNIAGNQDQFRLCAGQVAYWLGKSAEGKKQFDDLLAAHKRDFKTLMGVSLLLREVGAIMEARALDEEAYGSAKAEDEKSSAAMARALVFTDADDEIKWLRLADQSRPGVAGTLQYVLGEKAIQAGDNAKAEKCLRESLRTFAALPQDATVLNNSALSAFALYAVTHALADFHTGLDLLGRAAELGPRDSIILENYSKKLLSDVVLSLGEGKLGLDSGDLQLRALEYLWRNEEERRAGVKLLDAHPSFQKALAALERLLILAPQRPWPYRELAEIYGLREDLAGLRKLREKLKNTKLDQDELAGQKKYFAGEMDAELRKTFEARLAGCRKIFKDPSATPAAAGYAAGQAASYLLSLRHVKADAGAGEAVALAEESFEKFPSDKSRDILISVLAWRGLEQMAGQDRRLAEWSARTRRSLDPLALLAHAASVDIELARWIVQNADVQRILEMSKESSRFFPKLRATWELPFWRLSDQKEAARVAAALNSPLVSVKCELEAIISPLDGTRAIKDAILKRDAGDPAGAQMILDEAVKRGIPLP